MQTQLVAKLHQKAAVPSTYRDLAQEPSARRDLAQEPSAHRGLAQEDDTALVAAAQSGASSEVFEILVGRHRTRMLRAAMRFTRNQADAEDVVQQSLQKAFVHLQQFEGHSSFSTWLTRIAINESLMWLRRKSTRVEIPLEQPSADDGATQSLDFPDSGLNPEDSCVQQEQKEILSAALNELTPRQRKAIELRELGELSTEETARVMGLSVAAVKAQTFHGRRKLQKVMKRWMSPHPGVRVRFGQVISADAVASACG